MLSHCKMACGQVWGCNAVAHRLDAPSTSASGATRRNAVVANHTLVFARLCCPFMPTDLQALSVQCLAQRSPEAPPSCGAPSPCHCDHGWRACRSSAQPLACHFVNDMSIHCTVNLCLLLCMPRYLRG